VRFSCAASNTLVNVTPPGGASARQVVLAGAKDDPSLKSDLPYCYEVLLDRNVRGFAIATAVGQTARWFSLNYGGRVMSRTSPSTSLSNQSRCSTSGRAFFGALAIIKGALPAGAITVSEPALSSPSARNH
jgi:hypothetical protein